MINYEQLMNWNPTRLTSARNSAGQFIDFYECPIGGCNSPIIAACAVLQLAEYTTFYDCGDFYEDSDYIPVFSLASMWCEFEAPKRINTRGENSTYAINQGAK